MDSIEEYNNRKLKAYEKSQNPSGTGIACPKCGGELERNTGLSVLLLTNPPQERVDCPKCKYVGHVFV
jgi:ssDNA-binding Zn-finger/Zn-ribbon topoisomerase 1